MQTTKSSSKPWHKNKKVTKPQALLFKDRKSKSVVQPRFVASAPVRRQLPLGLISEHYAAVDRMQAFVSWATKHRFVKRQEAALKKNTFKRHTLRRNKISGGRLVLQDANKKKSMLLLHRQSGLSGAQHTFCSFAKPSLKSIWSFLTWYKQTNCPKKTSQWRTYQHKALLRWSKSALTKAPATIKRRKFVSSPFKKQQRGLFVKPSWKKPEVASRKYAKARFICLAHHRIMRGVGPIEAKVRLLQRRFKHWYLRRPRKTLRFYCLVKEYNRVCNVLSSFIAYFKGLKKSRKNRVRLCTHFKQVLRKILPENRSRAELKKLDAQARYNYILTWKFASFLWQFVAPDFVFRTFKLIPKVSRAAAHEARKEAVKRLPFALQKRVNFTRRKRTTLLLNTNWLMYGNKQATLVVRDQSLKYKKVWSSYAVEALKSRHFWQRRSKQAFVIGRKKKIKQFKRLKLFQKKIVRPVITTLPAPFISVFKRLLTTSTFHLSVLKKRTSTGLQFESANKRTTPVAVKGKVTSKTKKLRAAHNEKKRVNPATARRLRGFAKTKKLLNTPKRRWLFARSFWDKRLRYLKRNYVKLFCKSIHLAPRKFWLAIVQNSARLKLRRHRRAEYRLRYLSVGQRRYLIRKAKKHAYTRKLKLRLLVKRAFKKTKRKPQCTLRTVVMNHPLYRSRLLSAFYGWLCARSLVRRRVVRNMKKQLALRTICAVHKPGEALIHCYSRPAAKPMQSLLRFAATRGRVKVSTPASLKKSALLRHLRRFARRLAFRRLAKRTAKNGETHRMLLPTVKPTKLLPTLFDVAAMRVIVGKKWRKKVRKVRAARVLFASHKKTNMQLARLFPFTNLQAIARKSVKLRLPKMTSAGIGHQRIEVPNVLSTDSFPFNRRSNQERRQGYIDRKRTEILGPQLLNILNSSVGALSSSKVNAHMRGAVAHVSNNNNTLQRSWLSGFIQDVNRLDCSSKSGTYTALKRTLRGENQLNQKIIVKKLKFKKHVQASRRRLHSTLWAVWAKRFAARRQEITKIKQNLPRKGPRRRRNKWDLRKQLNYLLKPRKHWYLKKRAKRHSNNGSSQRSKNRAAARLYKKDIRNRRSGYPWGGTLSDLKNILLDSVKLKKTLVVRIAQDLKTDSVWRRLKHRDSIKFLSRTSYLSPQYRLRARLFTKLGRTAPSREEFLRRKKVNRVRRHKAGRLYVQRRTAATKWNKNNRPFRRLAYLGYEEKFKRNMHKLRWTEAGDTKTEYAAGYPAIIGQRRVRRVFVPKFNKNRWWKSTPVALAHHHPFALHLWTAGVNNSAQYLRSNGKKFGMPSVKTLLSHERQKFQSVLEEVGDSAPYLQGGQLMETLLPGLSKRRPFFTTERIWKGNHGWRLLEQGFIGENTKGHTKSSVSVVKKALASLEQRSAYLKQAWSRYAEKTSTKAAAQLRTYFIKNSIYWLRERPLESLTAIWTPAEWSKFNTFVSSPAASNLHHDDTEDFKARFISRSRQELFLQTPNWWQEETTARAYLLFKAMSTGAAPGVIMKLLAKAVRNRNLFVAQSGLGWQEKKLLVFSALYTLPEEQQTSLRTLLETNTSERKEFSDKPFTALYYTWLNGVETYLKRNGGARSSQNYNELRQNMITELGMERPRFPGTGRRKFTFDSLLRAHYTKTMPLRSRRLAGGRFQKIRSLVSSLASHQSSTSESTISTRRGQRWGQQRAVLIYPTKRSRELRARFFKTKGAMLADTAAKYRLAALPVKLSTARANCTARKVRSTHLAPNIALGEALLQHALRRRFVARNIRDLRKAGRRRKLPRYQSRPFWVHNKLTRKRNRSERCDRYKLPSAGGYASALSAQWACVDFSLQVARTSSRIAKARTTTGELLMAPVQLQRQRLASRTNMLQYGKVVRRWKHQYSLGYKRVKKMKLVRGKFNWRNLRRIRGRVHRLRKNAKWSNKYFPQQWRMVVRTTRNKLQNFDLARNHFHYRLLKKTQPSTLLTPLHFRKCSTHLSISAEENERWRLHIQATRQRKYRRLTEQAGALTRLFPQLISQIIEKKMSKTSLSSQTVAGLVQAIYWSLRVYLQHDFGRRKFLSRDDNVKRILELNKEITTSAAERFFNLLELTQARHQFQPHRLHPGPSLLRGAAEWQRRFLPRFYELNLEDPQKYGHLTVTPLKIFRATVSRKKISEWETRKVPGLMENRFIRLTTERHGKNSQYFENMLMTTRRLPIIGGYGAAATLQVINPVGSSSVRKPFFSRAFTTQAEPKRENLTLITSHMATLRRKTPIETAPFTPTQSATIHRALKRNSLARIRSQQSISANETGSGSIDIRLLRAKSPRNAEYAQRVTVATRVHLPVVAAQYASLASNTTWTSKYSVFRSTRASVANTFYPVNAGRPEKNSTPFLATTRGVVLLRRQPALLKTQGRAVKRGLQKLILRRLFTNRRSARAHNRRLEFSFAQKNKRLNRPVWAAQAPNNLEKQSTIISSERSILHFRKASSRSVYKYQVSVPTILNHSIKLNFTAWNLLKRHSFDKYLQDKIKLQQVRIKFKQKFVVKTRQDYKILNTPTKQYRKVFLFRNNLQTGEKLGFLKRFRAPARLRVANYWANSMPLTRGKKQLSYELTSYFRTFAKTERRNRKVISNYANQVEKKRARTLFTKRRPQLWRDLTVRWMKKFRLLKHWLKTVKYSFKHKVWGVGGEPALPDVLFKMSRLRLRKLEWRESNDRFERQGLRHAFTFHPKERRHARWLESLMYRRALYNYQRGEYKRDQFPREQKSRKWLQRLRKLMYRRKPTHLYIKRRRWPTLRGYNQKLHRSVFNISTSKAMLKRFRKLARRKPAATGFEKMMVGFGDRLDVNLLLLNIAPTTFWAREIAPMGLFKVNGKIIREASFRFTPGDHIELIWEKLQKLRTHFASTLKRYDKSRHLQNSSLIFPSNFAYNASLRTAQYLRRPCLDDLAESSRINARLFRWSRLDSGLGK